MTANIRLCLVLHNHQPVGNFEHVFEQAYQDSYLPFLDVLEPYADLKISLHTSGPLMEWLAAEHPEYLDRLAALVAAGRIEIVGGAFYEPILAMIPPRDRIGQIAGYRRWLEERLGGEVRGMWMPERVWEQPFAADLVEAGVKYTVLDDYHFKNAGLKDDQLHGYYITEDDGKVLSVFPVCERLRYTIPFAQPHETIDFLKQVRQKNPGAVMVFGDDGEKFGSWPQTKKHVYEDGWLRRFFDLLVANGDWLQTIRLGEAIDNTPPTGKIYLPDASYREMTEWALPVERQFDYDALVHELQHDPRWERIKTFVRGGAWRNFKVKYPEANEMYSRMMIVSNRFAQVEREGKSGVQLEFARRALYRAQCNCAFWHGAFGGVYLPHLRNAIFNQLIAADNLLDQVSGKEPHFIEASVDDYDFDARQEVRLGNDQLITLLAPANGGRMYELDVRSICHNLLATMARRPEAYHRQVQGGEGADGGHVAAIHDKVIFKQAGLDKRLQYDADMRKSLVDHFYHLDASPEAIAAGTAAEAGDFVHGAYEAKIRRNPDRIQVMMVREGRVDDLPVKITKGVTLSSGSSTLEVAYLLEGLQPSRPLNFAIELNFAGMPGGADDRYFHRGDEERFGQLSTKLDQKNVTELGLIDEWLGLDVQLKFNRPTGIWTYPVETVSQSEGGFELVHQSVCVMPHWRVLGDEQGRWSVTFELTCDTSLANERSKQAPAEAATAAT